MENANNSLFVNQDWNQSVQRLNALKATPGYGSPALQGADRANWDQFSGMPAIDWKNTLSNAQPSNGKQFDQFSGMPTTDWKNVLSSGGKRRSRKNRRSRRSKRSRKSRRHRK